MSWPLRLRWAAALAWMLAGPWQASHAQDVKVSDEARLKLAYLFNIVQFVEWPAATADTPLRLCVVGDDPFGDDLRALAGRTVKGRALQVQRPTKLDDIRQCHLVYLESLSTNAVPARLLEQLHDQPLLIVSGEAGALQRGAMIEFVTRNARLRWFLDADAVRRAGLRVSAKLIEVSLTPARKD